MVVRSAESTKCAMAAVYKIISYEILYSGIFRVQGMGYQVYCGEQVLELDTYSRKNKEIPASNDVHATCNFSEKHICHMLLGTCIRQHHVMQ